MGHTFDTLQIFDELKQVFSEEQSHRLAKVIKETHEAGLEDLATKADLKREIAELESRLIKWVIGVAGVQATVIITLLKFL